MKKTILFVLGVLLFANCNQNNTEKTTAFEETATAENHAEQHHNKNAEAIELDNGERWLVNQEMKPFVMEGEELVNTYIQEEKIDYKALAEQLKEKNDQLIRSCTMTGKSHDELHKWLHPHLEKVKALAEATDTNKANEMVSELKHSYAYYHEYFK